MSKQDTGKFRSNTKDQFYTSNSVAKSCVDSILQTIPYARKCLWIEPSAGKGAFLTHVPAGVSVLALDIEPKGEGILQQDFLAWKPQGSTMKLVFGNPPFGRQGSLAKQFLKHAGAWAQGIAFILPRSFQKPSMYSCIPKWFHKVYEKELETNSFLVNDSPYDVPCVFQIWERRATARELEGIVEAEGFVYKKKSEVWNLAIRRVGGLAGKAFLRQEGADLAEQSHYFLDVDSRVDLSTLKQKVCETVFPSNTTGPRSLSKGEINKVLNGLLLSIGVPLASS